MDILVVGSVALDSVETPFGKVEDAVGGSATFFSAAASYFAPVNLVAVVGNDYPMHAIEYLKSRRVDFKGLQIEQGETFRWAGRYNYDLNQRDTIYTHLNVFQNFKPHIPDAYKSSQYVFLGNIAPELQFDVLDQVQSPKLVALDTMNFWIEGSQKALRKVLERIDIFILNDSEARQLANQPNLIKAAKEIFKMGPKAIVIKKGEYGAALITPDAQFNVPAYPLEDVYDPTGAGDTFAGGFMGYIAKTDDASFENLKRAVVYGSAMASFCVQDFSINALKELSQDKIFDRVLAFKQLSHFEEK
ncbi:MAG TPA: PfkB family carbohydrate kinase [bacterium]|nr:PfkB family carbohydrate kinase [bacterium]HMW36086.1 PfkB family carbohydrate kinase [bacterium]HMY35451.1 PfkB family carbohydrate kinase [bacterium]HMZ03642.1 PfkB family carbohydrate kinase [bacterium]HNB09155.1 PfkB family carbohydrate kinase [bacterium]